MAAISASDGALDRARAEDLDRARAGDGAAFTRLVAPWRGPVHAHCYRMLGSVHDADDATQEAMLRAWRGLGGFAGRSSLHSWIYRVATRTCLDALAGRARRALPMDLGPAAEHPVAADRPLTEIAWLEPYPDQRHEQREAVDLAFVAALQHLPGNQRAALLLFEVLGFPASEIAGMMDTTTASVNSALQRARRVVAERVPARDDHPTPDAEARELVGGYARALERGDAGALVALLTADVTWAMPPLGAWYAGRDAAMAFARATPLSSCGSWRHRPARANGRPAVASYLRPAGAAGPDHTPWAVNVLTPRDGRIAAITSFIGTEHFAAFGLPDRLSGR